MPRFSTAAKALRGPFKELVRKLLCAARRPFVRSGPRTVEPSRVATAVKSATARSLADDVANATGGAMRPNKGGFTVTVPHGRRSVVVRVMEQGGERSNYFRVNVPGKAAYSVAGDVSSDAAVTHIPIRAESLDKILAIIARIRGEN
jgi:hypothetical protein